ASGMVPGAAASYPFGIMSIMNRIVVSSSTVVNPGSTTTTNEGPPDRHVERFLCSAAKYAKFNAFQRGHGRLRKKTYGAPCSPGLACRDGGALQRAAPYTCQRRQRRILALHGYRALPEQRSCAGLPALRGAWPPHAGGRVLRIELG